MAAVILAALYVLAAWFFNFSGRALELLVKTVDDRSYREAAKYIFENHKTDTVLTRPLGYPLFLGFFLKILGDEYFWLSQALLWWSSGFILFYVIRKYLEEKLLSWILLMVYGTHVSMMLITLHALTETLAVFLVTLLVFYVVRTFRKGESLFTFQPLTVVNFIVSLLTVVKPAYLPLSALTMGALFLHIIFTRGESVKKKSVHLLIFIAAISPQISQRIFLYKAVSLTTMGVQGSHAFNHYLFRQTYASIHNKRLDEVDVQVAQKEVGDTYQFVRQHLSLALISYLQNILDSLNTRSGFTSDFDSKFLPVWSRIQNKFFYWIHIFIFFYALRDLVQSMKRNFWSKTRILSTEVITPGFLFIAYLSLLASAGLVFWSGDRIMLPGFSLWVMAYMLYFYNRKVRHTEFAKISTH